MLPVHAVVSDQMDRTPVDLEHIVGTGLDMRLAVVETVPELVEEQMVDLAQHVALALLRQVEQPSQEEQVVVVRTQDQVEVKRVERQANRLEVVFASLALHDRLQHLGRHYQYPSFRTEQP